MNRSLSFVGASLLAKVDHPMDMQGCTKVFASKLAPTDTASGARERPDASRVL